MRVLIVLFCLVLAVFASEDSQPETLRGGILRVSENCRAKVAHNAEITLHYTARAWGESEPFENTYKDGEPRTYKLGRDKMMEGMKKGIQDMCEGEIRRVLVPADMAYGELGLPGFVPPNTAVVYDIEIVKVNSPFTNPWFYAGLALIAIAYFVIDRMSKATESAKAAKFMESRAGQEQTTEESKKDQ